MANLKTAFSEETVFKHIAYLYTGVMGMDISMLLDLSIIRSLKHM